MPINAIDTQNVHAQSLILNFSQIPKTTSPASAGTQAPQAQKSQTPATSPLEQLFQTLKQVAATIVTLNSSAQGQRQQDKKQGIGTVQGATNFSSEAVSFYDFISKLDPSKIKDADSFGALAQGYMQKQATQLFLNGVKSEFPETAKEVTDLLGIGKAAGTAEAGVTATTATAASSNLATIGSIGSEVLGGLGAGYALYQLFGGKLSPASAALSGAAAGAYIGSVVPGVGTVIGGVVGGIGGYLSSLFKSGKPKEQKERDAIRKQLQQAGILDQNWNIQLANGATFDMGKDGGATLVNKDGSQRKYTELDPSDPSSAQIAQLAAPLAQAITGGSVQTKEFAAYLTNAVTSNAATPQDALNNLQAIYQKCGLPFEQAIASIPQVSAATATQ